MKNNLKLFLFLFSFAIITKVIGQVDSINIINKNILSDDIESIDNFIKEKLLVDSINKAVQNKLVNQEEKLVQLKTRLDTFLSIVSNQNLQIDSFIINLNLLKDYLGSNKNEPVNENTLITDLQKNKINIVYLNIPQTNKVKIIDSASVFFDKNSIKLNSLGIATIDDVMPLLQNNKILLIGYYNENESNNKFIVEQRVNDIKYYLKSKLTDSSEIITEFVLVNNNFTNKVNIVFDK